VDLGHRLSGAPRLQIHVIDGARRDLGGKFEEELGVLEVAAEAGHTADVQLEGVKEVAGCEVAQLEHVFDILQSPCSDGNPRNTRITILTRLERKKRSLKHQLYKKK
jgi:hypothetical protein